MIGEMRDTETADIGIRAAITGHLVLSTLHTNDAASTVVRLIDMGVAPYMVATSLIGVIAQRLIKVLCPACKQPIMSTEEESELMGVSQPIQIYKPVGCPECNNTGYRGRTAIHEIIHCTAKVSQIIASGGGKEEIEEAYEKNTGLVIIETFKDKDPMHVPGVLCANHGPFTWGADAAEAVHNAVVLEEVAKMAYRCEHLNPKVKSAPQYLQDKHFFRKHGVNAYYGQGK